MCCFQMERRPADWTLTIPAVRPSFRRIARPAASSVSQSRMTISWRPSNLSQHRSAQRRRLGARTVNLTDTGTGTINDNDAAMLSISNVSLTEGNSGQKAFNFTVTLDQAVAGGISFDFTTVNGARTAGSDYTALSQTARVSRAPQPVRQKLSPCRCPAIQLPNRMKIFSCNCLSLLQTDLNVSFAGGGATLDGTGTILDDDSVVSFAPQIIDDGDAGFSTVGSWPGVTNKPNVKNGELSLQQSRHRVRSGLVVVQLFARRSVQDFGLLP